MLIRYDHLKEYNKRRRFYEAELNVFASEIMETLQIDNPLEIAGSLQRAFVACESLGISFERNFKKVYRFDGEQLLNDWKISPLASFLIIINCNPIHPAVARAQLYFTTYK